ncbi:ribonuclease H-like domain-containing protein [Favolaschia claudopus]|uniref:Ribonuclease H-like domain-containing protein n=1 Tax=Favolaschia claudopus TaxID=2862362 RepID=A0AAW0AIE4_9AGAR
MANACSCPNPSACTCTYVNQPPWRPPLPQTPSQPRPTSHQYYYPVPSPQTPGGYSAPSSAPGPSTQSPQSLTTNGSQGPHPHHPVPYQNIPISPQYQYYAYPPMPTNYIPWPSSAQQIQAMPPPSIPPTPATADTSGKRRRKNADAGSEPNKRQRRAAVRRSTQSNPPTSVDAADQCGVGPIDPPHETPPASPAIPTITGTMPSTPNIHPTDSPAPSRSESLPPYAAHDPSRPLNSESVKKLNSATATDVWFFVRPLKTNAPPAVLPTPSQPLPEDSDILDRKPNAKEFPYLGCRLCKRWQVWQNAQGGVTSNIRRHLEEEHADIYKPTVSRLNLKHASASGGSSEPYSKDAWVDRLVRWIVADDQSLNVVDCEEFREFVLFGRTPEHDEDLPHRTALTNKIIAQYHEIYEKIIDDIKRAYSRLHLTGDMWSDGDLASFLALSGHWLARDENGNLVIRNRLLVFRVVEGKHDGKSLAKIVFDIFKKAGLLKHLGQITLDNATVNDAFMRELQLLLLAEFGDSVVFHPEGNRIRCFPHVINIGVTTVIVALTEDGARFEVLQTEDRSEMSYDELSRYADAVAEDPIGRGRHIVASCRASGQRRSDLKTVIVQGNLSKCWEPAENGEAVMLPVVQLLRDCETRWSSTYLMNDRVIALYPAIDTFLKHPKQAAIANHAFTDEQFQVLSDIQTILYVPHVAQELLSAEKTPTISIAIPAFEAVLDGWLNLQKTMPELSYFIGCGIAKIQEYVAKGRKSLLNPTQKLHWIEAHWPADDALKAEEWTLTAMTSFMTADRHENKKRAETGPSLQSQSLTSNSDRAAAAQSSGLARLQGVANLGRKIATLPGSRRRTTTSTPSQVAIPSSPTSPPSIAPAARLVTPAEAAAAERAALANDRRLAQQEYDMYKNEPRANPEGFNLVRFWDLTGTLDE